MRMAAAPYYWVEFSLQGALANVQVVIEEWIETARKLGRTVPEPRGRLMFA